MVYVDAARLPPTIQWSKWTSSESALSSNSSKISHHGKWPLLNYVLLPLGKRVWTPLPSLAKNEHSTCFVFVVSISLPAVHLPPPFPAQICHVKKKADPKYMCVSTIGGLRPPKCPCFPGGLRPLDAPPSISFHMTLGGHSTCSIAMVPGSPAGPYKNCKPCI